MKKLVFMFVALAAMTIASCGGKTAKGSASDSTTTDSTDTVAVVVADSATVK